MRQSESCSELFAALSKAQGAMGVATKDGKNPHYKSSYATLASCIEAVRGPFAANGLAFVQAPTLDGELVNVETMLCHSSGQYIVSVASAKPAKLDPQAVGSAISYLKRYALMAVAGLPSADDDGEAAMERPKYTPVYGPAVAEPFSYAKHRELVPQAAERAGIPTNKLILVRDRLKEFLEANATTGDLAEWIDAFFKKEGDK